MRKTIDELEEKTVRILLVEDHPIMRRGLMQLIEAQPHLTVCGEASDFSGAMEALGDLKPDLMVVDISLPGKDGLEVIKEVSNVSSTTKCLALSMHDESIYAERVLRAGGMGYVMKREAAEKMVDAIWAVVEGRIYVNEEVVFGTSGNPSGGVEGEGRKGRLERLTQRETEIFWLIGQGRTLRQIADSLKISVKTVEAHRSNIREKLRCRTAAEMVRVAGQWLSEQAEGDPSR